MYCSKCGKELNDVVKFCPSCGFSVHQINESGPKANNSEAVKLQTTDPFAVITLAAALASLFILPIIFVPIGWLSAIVSRVRLKENPNLKGNGFQIAGAILLIPSMLWLFYDLGFFG